ncbi:hypothetical protein DIPPA_34506 [Diplonema papillatum]|nr:hypothetical protein DIPPA_34506 [Diplonema papillatum]
MEPLVLSTPAIPLEATAWPTGTFSRVTPRELNAAELLSCKSDVESPQPFGTSPPESHLSEDGRTPSQRLLAGNSPFKRSPLCKKKRPCLASLVSSPNRCPASPAPSSQVVSPESTSECELDLKPDNEEFSLNPFCPRSTRSYCEPYQKQLDEKELEECHNDNSSLSDSFNSCDTIDLVINVRRLPLLSSILKPSTSCGGSANSSFNRSTSSTPTKHLSFAPSVIMNETSPKAKPLSLKARPAMNY